MRTYCIAQGTLLNALCDLNGTEIQGRGGICVCMADSIYCIAETNNIVKKLSVQLSSVAQSCLTLCDPMNHSMPGLSVHHQLPESTQTPVHRVSDAIQPFHPLLSPSPPALDPSQHQGLFK